MSHDLQSLAKEVSLERFDNTKDEAPGELIKVVAADDAMGPTTCRGWPWRLAWRGLTTLRIKLLMS